ncbi:ethanolamine ammonia-lyase [Duganella sp. Leaf126]|uniref:ethanolamine ammonia-lyase subunit EutC n=1 Tax=Duganella sp. Leaf126 TaxID=1736266 RepID=UPI000700D0DF|nr:ethanolamine ammonia-lyase subunit EutC [Duganella sp. Leaf126]KQQ33077.1 ethanolamine ammonia-lyase [Duganella sp. Leaf126]
MSELQPRGTGTDQEDAADAPAAQALVVDNPWAALRRYTAARIALGRTGVSQPTAPQLAFQLAHAQARDAVHRALDVAPLAAGLQQLFGQPALALHSAAASRDIYLQRPDLGRRLDDASRQQLQQRQGTGKDEGGYDLALVVADGLSALAIEQHVLPFLACLAARLASESWTLSPPVVVEQGRVAVGDEVGELLGARAVLVLIGERPGLSSPDSMGLYLTWAPRVGLTDAARNCISNVRPAGLRYEAAAYKLHYLLTESRRRQLSGVALKDETADDGAEADGALPAAARNFLLE